jgi:hypothetical protein
MVVGAGRAVSTGNDTGGKDDHDPAVPAPGAGYEICGAPARKAANSARKIPILDP